MRSLAFPGSAQQNMKLDVHAESVSYIKLWEYRNGRT